VKEELPRWRNRLLPSSRSLESYTVGIADSPEHVGRQIDDLLSRLVFKDEVIGDILRFSVYSGAAAFPFSTRYHRALTALEVPVFRLHNSWVYTIFPFGARRDRVLNPVGYGNLPTRSRFDAHS
jgi:hypothetical protein